MKIAVDIDEVLVDTVSQILEYHNHTYNSNFVIEQVRNYNFWELWGGTREQAIKKVKDFYETFYFKQLKPRKDAVEAINFLKEYHKLNAITARHSEVIEETRKWIREYFSNSFSAVYFTNEWSVKRTTTDKKSELCKKLGLNLIIEDHPDYALDCAREGINAILFNKPWNQNVEHQNIIRANSWPEILEAINSFAEYSKRL